MVIEETNESLIEVIKNLPPEILGKIDNLIFVSKIAIWVFIGYIVFLIIKQFFGWRRNVRIDKMYHKVNEIDMKINAILKKKNIKEHEVGKPKEGWIKRFLKKRKDKKEKTRKNK